ncbi:MAG: ribonuclease E inhibitor RraB [Spirochaetae bacterium HGW-Spirochaetae-10]|nr:MAG: ribonuclease E inhibitor RraB [Spirochaetae bacterium HGW-Spirochaetae-10]
MIERSKLVDMFAGIRQNTQWAIDGPMLWGYFFVDPNRDKLEGLGGLLAEKGYRVVEIRRDDDEPIFWLHVEKVEIHDVDSLEKRNNELYDLAERLGIQSYDGMDVGPVPEQ